LNPFLVTATDRRGRRDSFVREAESLSHLRNVLEREGYVDIEFLDDEFMARLRSERPTAARDDSREWARLEAKMRKAPARSGVWLLAARRNWLFLSAAAAMLAYSSWRGRYMLAAVALALLVGWVLLLRAGLRKVDHYRALVRAQASGDLDTAAQLIETLAANPDTAANPQLQLDLEFRRACLRAKRGDLEGALRSVEPLRTRPETAAGVYEGRCASIHHQADDMPGFIRGMESSFAASGQATMNRVDLLFAHARVGDPDRAGELLAGVDRTHLSTLQVPIVQASEAMLRLRAGDTKAGIDGLRAAVEAFGQFSGNVAAWPIHGILVASLARALAASGQHDEALEVLAPWRAVALNCVDPETRRTLQSELAT